MTNNPKVLIEPSSAPLILYYQLDQHSQQCKCGRLHKLDMIYAAMPPARGSGVRLIPVRKPSEIEWNLPVRIVTQPTVNTLFCHECWHPGMLNHLPKLVPPKQVIGASISEPPEAKKAKAPKTATKAATADDLDWE